MTRLVRSFPGGERIHLKTCKRAGKTVPWLFPEGQDDDVWLRFGWLKPCRFCLPDQARRQDAARERATARPHLDARITVRDARPRTS